MVAHWKEAVSDFGGVGAKMGEPDYVWVTARTGPAVRVGEQKLEGLGARGTLMYSKLVA